MKKWGVQVALALWGVCLGLVIIEIALRTFYPQYGGKLVEFHPVLGFSLIPNYDGIWIWNGRESITHFRTNSLGLRDSEVQIPKPDNVFRILILGDSMTFGLGVEEEEAFPKLFEEMLNNHAKTEDIRFEVINAGVPGYGTAQELLQYQLYGQQLNPDLVILAFFVANDLVDNLCIDQILPDRTFVQANLIKPCFALRNGELIELHSPQRPRDVLNRKMFPSAEALHTWVFFRTRAKNILTSNVEVIEIMSNIGIDIRAPNLPNTFSWYMGESSQGWPLTEKLLDRLKEAVAGDGGKLVIVVFPSRPQTTSGYLKLTRILFSNYKETDKFLADVTRPQNLLLNWGEEEQVAILDCLPGFKKAASTQSLHLPDGHLNPAGYRVVTGLIYDYLLQNGLITHQETSKANR